MATQAQSSTRAPLTFFTFTAPIIFITPTTTPDNNPSDSSADSVGAAPFIFNIPDLLFQNVFIARNTNQPNLQGQPPASEKAIQSLPKVRLQNSNLLQHLIKLSGCEDCVICQDSIVTGSSKDETITVMPCTHLFHTACLDPWLSSKSNTCPTCRYPLPTSNGDYNASVVSPTTLSYSHTLDSVTKDFLVHCEFERTGLCECSDVVEGDESQNVKVKLSGCGHVFHGSCLSGYETIRHIPASSTSVNHLISPIRCPECRVKSQPAILPTPFITQTQSSPLPSSEPVDQPQSPKNIQPVSPPVSPKHVTYESDSDTEFKMEVDIADVLGLD